MTYASTDQSSQFHDIQAAWKQETVHGRPSGTDLPAAICIDRAPERLFRQLQTQVLMI